MHIRFKIIFLSLIFISGVHSNLYAACSTDCTKSGTIYTCTNASYDCINDAVQAANPEANQGHGHNGKNMDINSCNSTRS